MKNNALKPFVAVNLTQTLWNPTNEKFDMQYAGFSFSMEPGEIMEDVETNAAKHVVNAFGARGLTSLSYGVTEAEKERIGKDAIARNLAFKRKQVMDHNTRNEQRRQSGLPWNPPTDAIRKYAAELNVDIIEPAPLKEKGSHGDDPLLIQALRENAELKNQLKEIMGMLGNLTKPDEKATDPPPEKARK